MLITVFLQPDTRSTFVLIVLLTVFGMAVSATTAATVGGGDATPRAHVDCTAILSISGFVPHDDHRLARKRKAADQHDGTGYPPWVLLLTSAVAKLEKCSVAAPHADVRLAWLRLFIQSYHVSPLY